jgi:hypothetical protein
MNELHNKLNSDHTFASKEGQRDLLCSNNKSLRCPSLDYQPLVSDTNVDKAFDLLFSAINRLINETTYDDT